ncbi:MAG TPA: HupE/UreJ family protein, partial [Vicinamibacteria bacterium]|nr:HupE/UreJ family protein [Vicinamibacteria bacterium]
FTYTVVVLDAAGNYQADLTCDLDAVALGVPPGADSREVFRLLNALEPDELERRVEKAQDFMLEHVVVRFDGVRDDPELTLPEYGNTVDAPVPTLLGLTARFSGSVPRGVSTMTLTVDRLFPPVYLTVLDERGSNVTHIVLDRGAESDPIPVEGRAPAPDPIAVALRYFHLGLSHIVPGGLDHILFVLGLFLLSARPGPLLFQVSAFTLAHTLTLALSSYGVVRLTPSVVEPLIALSIAYVAVENVLTPKLTVWRPLVVFGFGLLHGMGFAGVLGELGLPRRDFLVGLLGFNAGVEAGQLIVLGAAFVIVGSFRSKPWYRSRVTVPLSLAVAAIGLYWTVERVLA